MIITCPNCSSTFTVPTGAIPEKGRKVKCSKCAHVWHQKPIKLNLAEVTPPPKKKHTIPEGSNLPVPVKTDGLIVWFKLATVISTIVLLISVFVYYQHALPALKPVYQAMGLHDTAGISFTKTRVSHNLIDEKHEFRVETELLNESAYPKPIPPIKVTVYDAEYREMGHFNYPVEIEMLDPGQSVYIAPEVNNVSARAQYVTLDIGNTLEIMFR